MQTQTPEADENSTHETLPLHDSFAEPAAPQHLEESDSFGGQLDRDKSQQGDSDSLQHASEDKLEQQPPVGSQLDSAENVSPINAEQGQVVADTLAPAREEPDGSSTEETTPQQRLAAPDHAAEAASFSGTASIAGSDNSTESHSAAEPANATNAGTEAATVLQHIQADQQEASSAPKSPSIATPITDFTPTAEHQVAGSADASHKGQAGSSEENAATQRLENGHAEPTSSQPGASVAEQSSTTLSQHETEAAEDKSGPSDVTDSIQDSSQESADLVTVPNQSSGVQSLLPGQDLCHCTMV